MVKNVLILTSSSGKTVGWLEREKYVLDFCKKVSEELEFENVKVVYTTFDQLLYKITSDESLIYDLKNKLKLEDFSFVHFKNWMYEIEEASVIARYLERHGVPFANSEVASPLNLGKLSQMFEFAHIRLSVPDSFFADQAEVEKLLNNSELVKEFKFPMIVKAVDGSKGDDNYLVKSKTRLLKILKQGSLEGKKYIIQNYIHNNGDYRILFIGFDQPPMAFLRVAPNKKTHLNNTSKGGSGESVPFNSLPLSIQKDSIKAAQALNREIGGVDVLIDKNSSKHYILEVNSTPAIATGYALEEKYIRFSKLLKKYLDDNEEE